ncbi:hypothetical protein [Leptotrichia trevisanii]|uniref:phage neck terminator protein n=1 Tax=Leptotrichia trevisanii TaxID=109328 RepID=UPI0026EBD4CB|nr:hypothetical protein [Leptotrichia trevisanii]
MDRIEYFRKLLNSFSNNKWQIVNGNILAQTPNYPYIEMFIINYSPDFHSQSVEVVEKENKTLVERNTKTHNATLQLNCRHKSLIESAALANELFKIINYVKRETINNNGFGIKEMSNIKSLNDFEGGKWNYCYSFDVEISFDVIEERTIETIETVKTNIKNKQEVIRNE